MKLTFVRGLGAELAVSHPGGYASTNFLLLFLILRATIFFQRRSQTFNATSLLITSSGFS